MKSILRVGFCICAFTSVFPAQTAMKELESAVEDFIAKKKIAYEIKYVLKANHSEESSVLMIQSGKFLKENEKQITMLDGRTTLITDKEVVTIDRKAKRIRLKRVNASSATTPDFFTQMQQYWTLVERVKKTQNSRKSITYGVWLKNEDQLPIGHYEITINPKTSCIEKMVFFYNRYFETGDTEINNASGRPRLEIYFNDRGNEVFSRSELQPEYYYSVTKNKLIPTSTFIGYDVKQIY